MQVDYSTIIYARNRVTLKLGRTELHLIYTHL